jgi:integrative and conjugative element protein (TIGR02256 family)
MPRIVSKQLKLPNGYFLTFADAAAKIFDSHRQYSNMPESGGILLGRIYDDKREVLIERASVPNSRDRSGHTFFDRSDEAAQEIIDAAWSESGGELIYLGEWHTHPEPFPTPSSTDRRMIANLLRHARLETDFLITAIIGQKGLWVGCQTSKKLARL